MPEKVDWTRIRTMLANNAGIRDFLPKSGAPLLRPSRDVDLLRQSLYFDADWYKEEYLDLREQPIDAVRHYLDKGSAEGRNPSPYFDTNYYLSSYPDVATARENPLAHYIRHGAEELRNPIPLFDAKYYKHQLNNLGIEVGDCFVHYIQEGWQLGLRPHALFDPEYYRSQHPQARDKNPLLDYLLSGPGELRRTHLLFDPVWYLEHNRQAIPPGEKPLDHYLVSGWREGCPPHPYFDVTWYCVEYPDVADACIDPFVHYLLLGWKERRSPHPLFDGKWYLDRYRDVAEAGLNPLYHYCSSGWTERRSPHPLFDADWYLNRNEDVKHAGMDPLLHYLQSGWRENRSTHPLFDPNWYLSQYPDVADAGLDPLRHYLSSGWREGRNPGPFFNTTWYRHHHHLTLPSDPCPLIHYLSLPEPNHQKPHPLFDPKWYSMNYAHLTQSLANPFLYYVSQGIENGHTPSVDYFYFQSLLDLRGLTPRELAMRSFISTFDENNSIRLEVSVKGNVTGVHYEVWLPPGSLSGLNVCIFALYAPSGYVPRSTIWYLKALRSLGYYIIVVGTSNNCGCLHADEAIPCDALLTREAVGFDFASWALPMQTLPTIWNARSILFTNDSIFGPLTGSALRSIFDRVAESSGDYIALTESWQNRHHYQSYFFVLKSRALKSDGVKEFWKNVKCVNSRDAVILRYELPMLAAMQGLGLHTEALFPLEERYRDKDVNPTLDLWKALIDDGFPFIKVQTLRDSITGVDTTGWQSIPMDAGLLAAINERLDGNQELSRKAKFERPGK